MQFAFIFDLEEVIPELNLCFCSFIVGALGYLFEGSKFKFGIAGKLARIGQVQTVNGQTKQPKTVR